jgi:tripartite-type tricarboxylate transporter receptor subunit TctC
MIEIANLQHAFRNGRGKGLFLDCMHHPTLRDPWQPTGWNPAIATHQEETSMHKPHQKHPAQAPKQQPGIDRRTLLAAGLGAIGLQALPAFASTPFPERYITLVLPFPGGGMFDAVLRAMANAAAKELGQPVVLNHKPGAGGVTGTAGLATMKEADGYTLSVMHNSVIRHPHMTKVSWDPVKDFTYVTGLASLTTAIAVAADAPWKTLEDLLADAKARPGQITWGNVGATSANRIYAQRLARSAGVEFNFIPYKGGAEQVAAVLGGHLHVYGDPAFGTMAMSGKFRLLATFTEQRLPRWQQVPTVKERGHDLVIQSPVGIVAPKGLDPAIALRLQNVLQKATQDPDYQRICSEYDLVPWLLDGAAYQQYAAAQYVREKQMLDEIGFKPQ